jgi:hypothetical protein
VSSLGGPYSQQFFKLLGLAPHFSLEHLSYSLDRTLVAYLRYGLTKCKARAKDAADRKQ